MGAVMGDGVLTPAVSVVSAVEGLKLAASGISHGTRHLRRAEQSSVAGARCTDIGPSTASKWPWGSRWLTPRQRRDQAWLCCCRYHRRRLLRHTGGAVPHPAQRHEQDRLRLFADHAGVPAVQRGRGRLQHCQARSVRLQGESEQHQPFQDPPSSHIVSRQLVPVGVLLSMLCYRTCSAVQQAQAGVHVLQALSPHHWFQFFLRNRGEAWRALSGVLLSATGTE